MANNQKLCNDYLLINHNDNSTLNALFSFYLWRDLRAIEKKEWPSVFAMLGAMARWKKTGDKRGACGTLASVTPDPEDRRCLDRPWWP